MGMRSRRWLRPAGWRNTGEDPGVGAHKIRFHERKAIRDGRALEFRAGIENLGVEPGDEVPYRRSAPYQPTGLHGRPSDIIGEELPEAPPPRSPAK